MSNCDLKKLSDAQHQHVLMIKVRTDFIAKTCNDGHVVRKMNNIGVFPFLSIALTLMFFPADFPIKVWNWLKLRFSKLEEWGSKFLLYFPSQGGEQTFTNTQKKMISNGLILLFLVHVMLPFRHHFYPGDVAWTEEGHRYSWRMMLRSKNGRLHQPPHAGDLLV